MARELDDDEITGLEKPTKEPAGPDPRQMALEVIDRNRIAEFNTETGSKLDFEQVYATPDPDADPDDAAAEAERKRLESGEPPAVTAEDQISRQSEEPKMVKVKVDGQEQEVPMDELIKNYQIGSAAQVRLQEATKTLREATELAERLKKSTQDQEQVHNEPQSTESEPTPPAALVKEAVDALFAGDPEAATAKLSKLVAGTPSQAPLDVDAVADRVRERIQVDSALSEFRSKYPKLLDPDLAYLTDVRISALRKEGKTLAEAIPLAGAALYDKFGFKSEEPPAPSASRQDRVLRKAAASDTLPVRTISAGGTSDPDNEPQPVSSILAEMRARRPGT